MVRDPFAARQIHAAIRVPLTTLQGWHGHLEDASWRPRDQNIDHGSHNRKLIDIEEKLIEEALIERSAPGKKDRLEAGADCRPAGHARDTRGLG
jgi:hypothetical protein